MQVPAAPAEVKQRLKRELFRVGSVWLPSVADLDGWQQSSAPLYLRVLGPDRVEIGPKLQSLTACRFVPVWLTTLRATPGGTRVERHLRFTTATRAVVAAWVLALIAWGAWISYRIPIQDEHPLAFVIWWVVLAALTGMGVTWGRQRGRKELESRWGWLETVLTAEAHPEEDW